jgi:hypothetical protein
MVDRRQENPGSDRVESHPIGGATPGRATAAAVGDMREQAAEVKDQVQQKAGEVKGLVAAQATDRLAAQKAAASENLVTVAHAFRHSGQQLRGQDQDGVARYIDQAAARLEQFADYLGGRDVRDLVRDAEQFARREPALFLGGAVAFGLLAARFLKSSAQGGQGMQPAATGWRGQQEWYGQPAPAGWTRPALPEASIYRAPGVTAAPAPVRPPVPPPGTEVGGVIVGGPPHNHASGGRRLGAFEPGREGPELR